MPGPKCEICLHHYNLAKAITEAALVQCDAKSSWHERTQAMLELAELPRNSSSTRLQNRCVLTGRSGGVLRQFKMSRIKFRELAELSILPGVKKSSW